MATVYVVHIKDHPEYKAETIAGESPLSVGKAYQVMREVPDRLLDDLLAYDCSTATWYGFPINE